MPSDRTVTSKSNVDVMVGDNRPDHIRRDGLRHCVHGGLRHPELVDMLVGAHVRTAVNHGGSGRRCPQHGLSIWSWRQATPPSEITFVLAKMESMFVVDFPNAKAVGDTRTFVHSQDREELG